MMTNRRPWSLALLGLAALLTACAGSAPPPETGPEAAPPTAEPAEASFTVEQAERGRAEFGTVCGECHSTGEFRGRDFQFKWRRRTAWDFFRNITDTMPENAPGSLSDEQYVDIIAYVLSINGFPAGSSELPATEGALDLFVMDAPPDP